MSEKKLIFMTGVTGVLGRDILKHILKTECSTQIAVLIRPKENKSAQERIEQILISLGLDLEAMNRIRVMEGDITEPSLGLNENNMDYLKKQCDLFYHIAATTNLAGSEKECFQVNVGGTKHSLDVVWDLYATGILKKFVYFSTAYVAGGLSFFCSKEDELPEKPIFSNYYESSKYRAEAKVREMMQRGVPTIIFRPSIVVGHSKTGKVSDFNVVYPFIKLLLKNQISMLPGNLENSINLVPIDFITEASVWIANQTDSVNKTYHLTSSHPVTIQKIIQFSDKEIPSAARIKFIDPSKFNKNNLTLNEKNLFSLIEPYLGYFFGSLTFDASNTKNIIKNSDLFAFQTDATFLKKLFDYALKEKYWLC